MHGGTRMGFLVAVAHDAPIGQPAVARHGKRAIRWAGAMLRMAGMAQGAEVAGVVLQLREASDGPDVVDLKGAALRGVMDAVQLREEGGALQGRGVAGEGDVDLFEALGAVPAGGAAGPGAAQDAAVTVTVEDLAADGGPVVGPHVAVFPGVAVRAAAVEDAAEGDGCAALAAAEGLAAVGEAPQAVAPLELVVLVATVHPAVGGGEAQVDGALMDADGQGRGALPPHRHDDGPCSGFWSMSGMTKPQSTHLRPAALNFRPSLGGNCS